MTSVASVKLAVIWEDEVRQLAKAIARREEFAAIAEAAGGVDALTPQQLEEAKSVVTDLINCAYAVAGNSLIADNSTALVMASKPDVVVRAIGSECITGIKKDIECGECCEGN
jgi:hypothetical protein